MSDIYPFKKVYKVRAEMGVIADSPEEAAQIAYALHHEMTPEVYIVATDGNPHPVRVELDKDRLIEALNRHRAGDFSTPNNLKD